MLVPRQNMGKAKWIGAFLGFITTHSVLGALAGYALGLVFDAFSSNDDKPETATRTNFSGQPSDSRRQAEGQRNGFLFSLMVLAAHIIKADGKIMHSEMELMRRFLRSTFGEVGAHDGEQILLRLFEYRKREGEHAWHRQIMDSCGEMQSGMEWEHRQQLMAFLCEVAKADGHVDASEVEALQEVAVAMGLPADIVSQMLSLGSDSLDDAYAVLGITAEATDAEVRAAYKKMALQHHPDRVATLGDDVKAAATRKFQEINAAKDRIFKARGMR